MARGLSACSGKASVSIGLDVGWCEWLGEIRVDIPIDGDGLICYCWVCVGTARSAIQGSSRRQHDVNLDDIYRSRATCGIIVGYRIS